ncbi:MAG TPA: LamG domain-containing protein [Polyangia bacterium]|nr:LamG domain-containing protein [Polyangia bacterium]
MAILVAVAGFAVGGCFAPPEPCHGCRDGLIDSQIDAPVEMGSGGDAGTTDASGAGGATGTGGAGGTTSVDGAIDAGAGGATGVGGTIDAGAGGATGAGGAIDVDLVAWYRFDDVVGRTTAVDSASNGRTARLISLGGGSAAFSTTAQVGTGALNLTSTSGTVGGFVALPASLPTLGATTAVTISCWVNVRTVRSWQRIFDLGSNTTTYMSLTAHALGLAVPNVPRFAITVTGNGPGEEEAIVMARPAPLSVGAWHHLAVVLGPGATYTGTLYIDKVAVGANRNMTLRPSNLGNGTNNWLGRSQFGDPLFDGMIDDFRVYRRALTADEIQALP